MKYLLLMYADEADRIKLVQGGNAGCREDLGRVCQGDICHRNADFHQWCRPRHQR